MNRMVLGAVSALLLAGAGLFWWQGKASTDASAPPPPIASEQQTDAADGEGLQGAVLPAANEASREEKRFNRLDRNRDSLVSRAEALQPRIAAFRKLDKDGNNLLSFVEWAVTTTNKFRKADADGNGNGNGNGNLNRAEFATTKPRVSKKPGCLC